MSRHYIVTIYKGGNKMEPLNYRPVSLTSIVSKLCEIVIKDILMGEILTS